jgi:hypothetical protein
VLRQAPGCAVRGVRCGAVPTRAGAHAGGTVARARMPPRPRALYDAVNGGRIHVARLRQALASLPLPRWDDGRIRLAADVSNWLIPEAATCPGEHMFRFFRQVLGWTRPKLRDPVAADRWTWIIITCYAQLYLARRLAAGIRLPWQRPCPPGRLTLPGSAAGSATSARYYRIWPARRNPAYPALDDRPDPRTTARPPALTWVRPSSATSPRREPAGGKVKQQAKV